MAIKVTLRQKPISGGRKSLYLDFYPAILNEETNELTRREFLGRYIFATPKTAPDKLHNKEALIEAEFIRQKRENELNKPEIYTEHEKERLRIKKLGGQSFKEFFQQQADKRDGKSKRIWESTLFHLNTFHPSDIRFADLNEKLGNDFKEFLLKGSIEKRRKARLARNTASVYFSKFRTALRQAYRDGLIQSDLNAKVEGITQEETQRVVFTLEEINALIRTECKSPILKKAAIFSVYSGLRFVDIEKLTWGEIEQVAPGDWVINFRQKKTKGVETLPISEEAVTLLGARGKDTEKVFKDLQYSDYFNRMLAKWIALAGISKDATFHSFRHTFATMQLTLGTDIYTVSKMLGHRDLKTTQIYAKIVDEAKRKAAGRITLPLIDWK